MRHSLIIVQVRTCVGEKKGFSFPLVKIELAAAVVQRYLSDPATASEGGFGVLGCFLSIVTSLHSSAFPTLTATVRKPPPLQRLRKQRANRIYAIASCTEVDNGTLLSERVSP